LARPNDQARQWKINSGIELGLQGDAQKDPRDDLSDAQPGVANDQQEAECSDGGGQRRDLDHARRIQFQKSRRRDQQSRCQACGDKPVAPENDQKNCRKKNDGAQRRQHSRAKNGNGDVLEDLSQEERVKRRLVVPNLSVEFEAFQTECGFREREPFIPTDLYRGSERQQPLEKNE